MILDIHLEYCDDKGERFKRIEDLDKPFNISIVPVLLLPDHEVFRNGVYPFDYFYNKNIMETLRRFAGNPNVSFGQQGFAHYCPDCFKRKKQRDPWHENKCLYNKAKSVEEQMKFMREGKIVVEEELGVSPIIYATPNHQFDQFTKIAARNLGFIYFADRGIINVPPYREDGLIILPQRNLGQKTDVVYTHYDQMQDNLEQYLELIRNSSSLESLDIPEKPQIRAGFNYRLLNGRKRLRDFVRRFKS